jgi:dTDP-4-amino-4,6-dideoxygalactose transaminase
MAALAPAPLQLQYGRDDPFLDTADSAAAGAVVRAGYLAAGASDSVQVLELPMSHGTDHAAASAFFAAALAEPLSPSPVPPLRVHFDPAARREVLDRVDESLGSGELTLGPHLRRLEALAAPWVGGPALGVGSGSAALELALRVIDVAGRAVLMPVNTFVATAAAALHAGARVEALDMESVGLGLDPDALADRLDRGSDVAAVIVVHIGGLVSPAVPDILNLCEQHGVPVVEDAAHALGSTLDGRPAGAFGRISAFSLYPTKVVTSGEGGLVAAARKDDLRLAARLRDHGRSAAGSTLHDCLGGSWRMSEVQAAVGIAPLERLGAILEERRRLMSWYDEHIDAISGLRRFVLPVGVSTNGYKYIGLLPDGVDRVEFKARLRDRHGVSLAGEVYDVLLCDQPVFRESFPGAFPQAAHFSDRHICLPLYPTMGTDEQERVLEALRLELS